MVSTKMTLDAIKARPSKRNRSKIEETTEDDIRRHTIEDAVCRQAEAFNASVVLIEDKASGTHPIQELVELGLHAVTRYQPQSDKIVRSRRCQRQRRSRQAKLCFAESMHAQTAMIENG